MNNATAADHPFLRTPHRTLLTLSLPVMLSLIAEPLTGLVDTAFVAQLDAVALAALGVGATALTSTYWVFNFLGIGVQTTVAQALGNGRDDVTKRMVSMALVLCVLIGLGLVVGVWLGAVGLSRLLGATGEVLPAAVTYTRIRILGAPAILLMMATLGAMRGWQDMRTTMLIAVGVNALNIVLDALLVFGVDFAMLSIPALGIAGAAWASTISQYVGAAVALALVLRRLGFVRDLRFSEALQLFVVGRDLFLRTGLLLFFVALATRVANQGGAEVGAAHQAIRTVFIFTAFVLEGFATTSQSLVGYFLGARLVEVAKQVVRLSLGWGLGAGVVMGALMLGGQGWIQRLFVPEAAVAAFAPAWIIAAFAQPLNAFAFVTDGVHWGTGDYRYLRNAMFVSTLVSSAALFALDTGSPNLLVWMGVVQTGWIVLRGILGTARIWPGVGRTPFAVAGAQQGAMSN